MMAAIEAGAEDVESGEDGHIIWCADTDLNEVSTALEAELGESESTKLVWRPTTTTELGLEDAQKLMKLIEALEDDDDIQTVTSNFEISDEVMEQLSRDDRTPEDRWPPAGVFRQDEGGRGRFFGGPLSVHPRCIPLSIRGSRTLGGRVARFRARVSEVERPLRAAIRRLS
jgi:hypothetical protein